MKNPTYISTILHLLYYEVDYLTREEMLMIIRTLQGRQDEGIPDGYWSTNITKWVNKKLIIRHDLGVYIGGTKCKEYIDKTTPYPNWRNLKRFVSVESKTLFYKRFHNKNQNSVLKWKMERLVWDSNRKDRVIENLHDENDDLREKIDELENRPLPKGSLSTLQRKVVRLEKELEDLEKELEDLKDFT